MVVILTQPQMIHGCHFTVLISRKLEFVRRIHLDDVSIIIYLVLACQTITASDKDHCVKSKILAKCVTYQKINKNILAGLHRR